MKSIPLWLCAMLCAGCVGQGHWGERAQFPSGATFSQAALNAARSPQTWMPLVTAGVLVAADLDNELSEDLWEDQPVFGRDAEDASDDLLDIASAAYVITALLAPSPTLGAKVKGLAVGAGTVVVDGILVTGLKELSDRERPDGSNNNSMPSGHASQASSRTAMAQANLRYMEMPDWSRQVANWSLHGVAVGTGLARVEAGKHHLSDVMVGYAIGHFLASFMYEAFLEGQGSGAQISFQPVDDGGAFTLSIPLH